MPFYTYILYSRSHNRFYKGHCNDLERRLREHNNGRTKSNKAFRPWEIIYFETFDNEKDAILREKYFKTSAGRRFLKKKINLSH